MAQKKTSRGSGKKNGSSSAAAGNRRKANTASGSGRSSSSTVKTTGRGRKTSSAKSAGSRNTSSKRTNTKSSSARMTAAQKKALRQKEQKQRDIQMGIALVIMFVAIGFTYLSLAGFCGSAGKVLSQIMFGLFGLGAWAVPVWVFVLCFFLITRKGVRQMPVRLAAGAILILVIQCAGHLYLHLNMVTSMDTPYNLKSIFLLCAENNSGGGILGAWAARLMYRAFGVPGSVLVYVALFVIAIMLLAQQTPAGLMRKWQEYREERGIPAFSERREMRRQQRQQMRKEEEEERLQRDAERILRHEERVAERARRREEEEALVPGKKNGKRRKKAASGQIDLESMLLDQGRGNSGKKGSVKEDSGRGKKGGSRINNMDRQRDVHEIVVLPEDEGELLTAVSPVASSIVKDNASPLSGAGYPAYQPAYDAYEGKDPEGTTYRRPDQFADPVSGGRNQDVHLSNADLTDEDLMYVDPAASVEEYGKRDSAYRVASGSQSAGKAGPGEGRSADSRSARERDTASADVTAADIGSTAKDIVKEAGKDAGNKAGTGNTAAASSASASSSAGGGFTTPSEEDLEGISVHRDTEKGKGSRIPGRIAASRRGSDYVAPTFSLLERGTHSKNEETERELKETAYRLQETLRTFGVQVTITDISQGPSVTRYELKPDKGVKVSKIVNLSDDIKLRLAASDIRIEAPIPGKSAVGIEVPNKTRTTMQIRELLESKEFRSFNGKIPFAVGKDIVGRNVITDIARLPHLLIAGATGSGKSVCINTIIMSILYRTSPEKVRLLLIDPKVVELNVYQKIPHLIIPVVTDVRKASAALNWAVAKMSERYDLFAAAGVRDLDGYNALAESYRNEDGEADRDPLPRIVIIVDELADLMMVSKNEVETAICRLAQMARAAGIHLIIATQRPSVDVITGLIKANMPSRIAFSVTSLVDSRTILDMAGAEKLIGSGDMLFYPQGYPKPARIQGAFISDEDVTRVVDYIKKHNTVDMQDKDVEQQIEDIVVNGITETASGEVKADPSRDEYFADAGRYIIEKNKASIGLLQRVFKIGFNRAARIMDQLADAGVVSEESSTRARQILMSMPEFEAYLENGP